MTESTVGSRIREAREDAGLEREDLADAIPVHVGSVNRWETDGAAPTDHNLRRIAKVTGAPFEWLKSGGEKPPRQVREQTANYGLAGDGDLSLQVGKVLDSDLDELIKTSRIVDLWATYRQKAISDLAGMLERDRELLTLRAQAVDRMARVAEIEAEEAAERRRQIDAAPAPPLKPRPLDDQQPPSGEEREAI